MSRKMRKIKIYLPKSPRKPAKEKSMINPASRRRKPSSARRSILARMSSQFVVVLEAQSAVLAHRSLIQLLRESRSFGPQIVKVGDVDVLANDLGLSVRSWLRFLDVLLQRVQVPENLQNFDFRNSVGWFDDRWLDAISFERFHRESRCISRVWRTGVGRRVGSGSEIAGAVVGSCR